MIAFDARCLRDFKIPYLSRKIGQINHVIFMELWGSLRGGRMIPASSFQLPAFHPAKRGWKSFFLL